MAKLTDLTEVTTLADGDLGMVVDVSNTSMDATGTNSKVTLANIYAYIKTKTDALYQAIGSYLTASSTDTLSNKSISLTTNTLTGTKAQFDTAVTDGNFMYIGDAPTSHTHTLSAITDVTASAAEVNVLDGITSTTTELNYTDGVTSSIQTQLDAKLPLSGGTMTGNITLGENTSIDLDPAGSADGKYSGICITGTAGTTLAFGDLIYLAVADSRWELTDADATATAGTPLLGMCVLAAAGDGNATKILLQGTIRADAKFPALTVGAPAYVGETAGAIQTAIPTGADNVIRVVGRALTADELYFCPSQDHQITVA
jgi:hypothetical protein